MQITFQSITENQQKSKIAQDILADLPMWFGIESETEEYIENVKNYQFIQVSADSFPIGFISINQIILLRQKFMYRESIRFGYF